MWNLIGVAAALGIALLAWLHSRAGGGFYAAGVYGMSPAVHRRYAIASLAFAAGFALAFALSATTAGLAGLAVFAVIAILYLSSFVRGASDYHE
jgi:hypothetical protein